MPGSLDLTEARVYATRTYGTGLGRRECLMRGPLLVLTAVAITVAAGLPLANARVDHPSGSGRAQVERQLVGSWRLVSFVVRSTEGRSYPLGKDAVGKLTYTRDGNVWAMVARSDRPKNLPDALWYTGTFRVELKRRTIVHQVEHASIPVWEGGDQLRKFRLRGDRLTLSAPPTQPGAGIGVLKWERIDSR